MSDRPEQDPEDEQEPAPDGDPKGQEKAADYEVGYGKPPRKSQFAKGRSGNPRGRPRKPEQKRLELSDAPSDYFLGEEAYRDIVVHENGKTYTITATQAVFRSLLTGAIKGNRLSQKYVIQLIANTEKIHRQNKVDRYARLNMLKRQGEQAIAAHERLGVEAPLKLLPHPEDIVLNPETGEAYIDGPVTAEELSQLEYRLALRDHLLLRFVEQEDSQKRPTGKVEGERLNLCLTLAYMLDRCLPRRHRWPKDADRKLMMDYWVMPAQERRQRIKSEFKYLEANRPPPVDIPPAVERAFSRLYA